MVRSDLIPVKHRCLTEKNPIPTVTVAIPLLPAGYRLGAGISRAFAGTTYQSEHTT